LFRSLRIPLPDIEAQRLLVERLDALQDKVDEVKRLQAEMQAELDALLPSILDHAFRGEL
jgi:type I restriction enzyme S subunit